MSFRCCKKQNCLKKDEPKEETIEAKAEQIVEENKEETVDTASTTESVETKPENNEEKADNQDNDNK